MRLTLAQRALLVKLFYLNQSNAAATLSKFRSRNNLRKGPLSINAVKAMVKKFEKTGSFTTRPGRGRKPVSEDTITYMWSYPTTGCQCVNSMESFKKNSSILSI